MRSAVPAGLLVALTACGGNPQGPTPPPPPPPPPAALNWTIAGQVVDTAESQPVAAATLGFANGTTLTADAGGGWQLQGTGTSVNQTVTVSAAGHVSRETAIRWDSAGRADVRLDLIAERSPFSIEFYRQFVRNAFEEPENPRVLRRWVRTPNFYIDTRNPKTEGVLLASEVADIERAIREAVPQITGGQLSAGAIESGAAPFVPRADYIEVAIVNEPESTFCATALIAANPGRIRINYGRCPSRCGGFSWETVVHEVGHSMGFWHHSMPNGIMSESRPRVCENLQFSEMERYHARIAYNRPPGNTDPDRDPSSFVALQTAAAPLVSCH